VATRRAVAVPWLGLRPQGGHHSLDHPLQVQVDAFQLETAGIHFGEIQQIFDQTEQFPTALLQLQNVTALPSRQLGLKSQIGRAQNGVEWGSQLVAHVGQKSGSQSAGLLDGLNSLLPAEIGHHQAAGAGVAACF